MQIVHFSFFTQNGRQSPMGGWQLSPFFRSGPRIVISQSGNLGCFLQKFHGRGIKNALFIRVSGVWGAKKAPHCCFSTTHRPTLTRQLPPLKKRNMSRLFTCVAVRLVPTAAPSKPYAYPRSWRTMRHEKPRPA